MTQTTAPVAPGLISALSGYWSQFVSAAAGAVLMYGAAYFFPGLPLMPAGAAPAPRVIETVRAQPEAGSMLAELQKLRASVDGMRDDLSKRAAARPARHVVQPK